MCRGPGSRPHLSCFWGLEQMERFLPQAQHSVFLIQGEVTCPRPCRSVPKPAPPQTPVPLGPHERLWRAPTVSSAPHTMSPQTKSEKDWSGQNCSLLEQPLALPVSPGGTVLGRYPLPGQLPTSGHSEAKVRLYSGIWEPQRKPSPSRDGPSWFPPPQPPRDRASLPLSVGICSGPHAGDTMGAGQTHLCRAAWPWPGHEFLCLSFLIRWREFWNHSQGWL